MKIIFDSVKISRSLMTILQLFLLVYQDNFSFNDFLHKIIDKIYGEKKFDFDHSSTDNNFYGERQKDKITMMNLS